MLNSFKYRFILSFVSIEIFFILCIVSINFITLNKSTSQLIQSKIQSTSQLMKELVKAPISVYDLATLDNITEKSNIPNISSIVILDAENKILSKNYNQRTPLKDILKLKKDQTITEDQVNFDLKYIQVMDEDILLGSIYLVFDMSKFTELISQNKTSTFFIILLEILISTIISFFIGHKLTINLTKLSSTAEELGKSKDLNIEIPYKDDKTEIGILSKSLDQMRKDLIQRNQTLKDTNDVFENIKEAILVFDENGNITLLNDAVFKILEISPKQLEDKTIFNSEFNIDNSKLVQIFAHLKNHDEWQGEYTLTTKDKKPKVLLLNFSKVPDTTLNSYIMIFSDISMEKEKESMLQVQSKMATMGEMIGNIAHQWRQPLSAISSSASGVTLQKELGVLSDEDLIKALKNIVKTTQFLSDTIEDFRGFFKREKEASLFKVSEVLDKITNIINSLLKNKSISLELDLKDDPDILGYQNELTQALLNIINNAKDALIEQDIKDKTIYISARLKNDNIIITIHDNAGGISKEIINKIFEPYFTTKHQSQGTGIGLFMTHTIITKNFKGTIKVDNTPIKLNDIEYMGACFSLSLPIK